MFVGNDYLRGRKLAAEPVTSLDVGELTDVEENEGRTVHNSVLLATGSADSCCYIFDISGPPGSGATPFCVCACRRSSLGLHLARILFPWPLPHLELFSWNSISLFPPAPDLTEGTYP